MTRPEDVVAALRRLIETVRTADLDAAALDLADLEARLDTLERGLHPHVIDGPRMQAGLHPDEIYRPGDRSLEGVDPNEFFRYSPEIGVLNPLAPPFRFWPEGEEMHGVGSFNAAYCGPPDAVHGGHVAAVMDELLGSTGVHSGHGGFTGTLSIRYEALTPLDTELRLRSWVESIDGRKTTICGELHAGTTRCATAHGIFIKAATN